MFSVALHSRKSVARHMPRRSTTYDFQLLLDRFDSYETIVYTLSGFLAV